MQVDDISRPASAWTGGIGAAPATICFPFAGGIAGGSHISAAKLIKALDRARYRPLVVLHRGGGQVAQLLDDEGIVYELAPSPRHLAPGGAGGRAALIARFPHLALTLTRFLRRRRVSIVHTNDGAMHATWALPARLAGAKLLWHHRGNPNAAGLRYLAPWLASRVVAVSDYAAPRPGPVSAAAKCEVVRSPFDIEPVRGGDMAALRTELGLEEETRVLGFFGHFTDRKRPLVFVDAVAELVARDPSLPVVGLMFGDVLDPGLDRAVTRRAAERGVAGHIRLMGFRTPAAPWMQLCDMLVVTAVEEPFGRTLIEAMLLGVPVVAAASGGNLEAIRDGETGLLVPPDRPGAFADAILGLLRDDRRRADIAERAGADSRARFCTSGHVRSISSIYEQLAAA